MFPHLTEKPNKGGFYEIRWTEDGRYRSRSTRARDRAGAEAAFVRFLAETRHQRADDRLTVAEAVDAYLRHHADPRGAHSSESNLRPILRAFGGAFAARMHDANLGDYTLKRLSQKVKPQTVRREITALQAVLNWCSKRGMIPGRPVFRLERPSTPDRVRDVWLTEDDERKILDALPGAPLNVRVFTRLALTYGARRGAIMELKTGPQIDFRAGTVNFNVPGRLPSRKRRPHAPMTEAVRRDLMEICAGKAEGERIMPHTTPDDFGKWMTLIGYGWVTPHVLKHSAITLMLRGGARLEDVAAATNTSLQTIMKVYRHHSADEMLAVLERRRA